MIVCVCHGVRCSKVRAAIRDGAATVDEVGEACGAGTDCGSCQELIEDLIQEEASGVTHVHGPRTSLPVLGRNAA